MRFVPLLLTAACCTFFCSLGFAAGVCPQQSAPHACIDKIDPPNWWVNMPSPMLLLHGTGLGAAHVEVKGDGVSVTKTQASENGHWLFVWLQVQSQAPQTLALQVQAADGSKTAASYELRPRKSGPGFAGVSNADTMYLIMTDRFADGDTSNDENAEEQADPSGWHGGDFKGIEQHLDYLRQLGVTTVWTTPIYRNVPSPHSYHGYSATDLYDVDPHFGTVQDYVHLADALHERGMKIVLDTVPNHVGPANPWVKDPPLPDWFHGTAAHHDKAKTDFQPIPDPHATWAEQRDILQGWFADLLPDMNTENPVVTQYLTQNTIWWVQTAGLDGLRIDTFPYVDRAFWQHFLGTLHTLFPNLTEVGEVFNQDPTIVSYFAGGATHDGIDTHLYTPFDYPMYFVLRQVLVENKPATEFENILRQDALYPHPERLVTFFGNHDVKRFMSAPGATIAELKMAYGLVSTLRGTPEIYSGDELGMMGGDDPDNRRNFPGGFHDNQPSAFEAGGRSADQSSIFEWTSNMLRLRREHPAITSGLQQDIVDNDASVFGYLRTADPSHGCVNAAERIFLLMNNGLIDRTLTIKTADTGLSHCVAASKLAGPGRELTFADGAVTVTLPAKSFSAYTVR